MKKLNSSGERFIKTAAFVFFISIISTLLALLAAKKETCDDFVFCDISLDHPAYDVCKNIISLGCVCSSRTGAFRAYEQISASEFNNALLLVSKAKNIKLDKNILFKSDSEIDKEALKKRFLSLSGQDIYDNKIFDCSRLAVFYMLEKCFFKENYG